MSMYAVVDPATGETLKEYPTITDDELRDAIARADRAHREWSRAATVADRALLVRRVGELHSERRKELAEIIVAEMGKPVRQARGEVDFCASIYGFYADNAEALTADEPIELLEGEGSAVVRRSSLGVLLGIMPWNFPYYQVARFAAPNLIIGNTVLLKHAPQCPQSAEAIAQMFRDAGFPDGAYVSIYATNEQIEWVIADPRVRGVSVTGSERAGAAVAEIAGRITTGALTASIAAGAFLSSLFSGPAGRVRHHGLGIERAILVYGGAMAAFGLVLGAAALGWFAPAHVDATTPNLVLITVAALTMVVAGGADNISSIFRNTMVQAAVPDAIRGRLQGVFIVVVAGGPRLGALYAGTLATFTALWFPPLLGGFVIIGLVGLLVRLSPGFRAYDADHPVP